MNPNTLAVRLDCISADIVSMFHWTDLAELVCIQDQRFAGRILKMECHSFRSPQFSFLVGKQRSCLTVHAGVLQNVSEPLWALTDNGQMKESTSRIAVLGDTDEDVFIGFCEHVYTGAYITPDLEGTAVADQSFAIPVHVSSNQEDPSIDGGAVSATAADPIDDFWGRPISSKKKKKPSKCWLEERELKPDAFDKADNIFSYEGRWKKFRALQYRGLASSIAVKPDLLFHAKLYVFATRYIIEPLQTQAVKSLHRDLCNFSLSKETASQILGLLEFTYQNTARYEPSGRSLLRDVVIQYVACEVQMLAGNEDLYSLLDVDGEMGSDLVAKLIK
uniref:BTB domain-containing protein n=1 Tax=Coccidioides posadasii RMSCC 3488 TaxID=454284 RepID=A0A0J6F7H2_COCPO|nr:hypothetical protein CPAG_05259 [Coccidioides posadasii RMSCC 3488]